MSWSFNGVGKPEALKRAIDADVARATGQSREEYEQVAPHLKGILDAAHADAAVQISANGHATFTNGERTYAYIAVDIKQIGTLVE